MFKKLTAGILCASALFAASAKAAPKVTVTGSDGKTSTFGTIQAALDSLINSKGEYTIKLPKGTYEEVLYYKGDATITLSGDTKAAYGKDVVIAKDNNGDLLRLTRGGSAQKKRCLFEFEGNGNLILENLTMINTYDRANATGSNGQAETLGFDGTGTVAAYNCAFKSHQDTLRTTGKTWFYKCYIEGDTDFIWMESSGKVALYEECEIVSVYDPAASNHTSYIGAPRMNIGSKAGKGLVVFNSTVSSQKNQVTFFGRTPWTSGYLNQIAFVNVKASGINPAVWSGKPLMVEGIAQNVIGWKMDKATAASLKISADGRSDILSDKDASNEYNGRNAILNRSYDLTAGRFKKDADIFDTAALAAKKGWKVSADTSKALLPREKESVKTEYVLDGSGDVSALKCDGFAQEGTKAHYQGGTNATISLDVTEKCLVTITGYYAGSGTIQAGKQGAAVYDLNNGSTNKFNEKTYAVYEVPATVTIKAASKSYITKITVETDDALTFRPVESIQVKTESGVNEVSGRKSIQMLASLNPAKPTNNDFVWSVSDEKMASIDENGVLIAAVLPKDGSVKVRATSRDEKAVYGEMELKILKPEAGAFSATWLDSPASSSSLAGTCDDEKIAKAGKAKTSGAGTWKHNASKITSDIAKGSVSLSGYGSPIAGKDKVWVEFPITANQKLTITDLKIAYGNHGTGNMASVVTYKVGKEQGIMVEDQSRAIRSTKKEYKLSKPVTVPKGATITIRVALYGWTGQEIAIPTGKAPTVATVTVNGKQN